MKVKQLKVYDVNTDEIKTIVGDYIRHVDGKGFTGWKGELGFFKDEVVKEYSAQIEVLVGEVTEELVNHIEDKAEEILGLISDVSEKTELDENIIKKVWKFIKGLFGGK